MRCSLVYARRVSHDRKVEGAHSRVLLLLLLTEVRLGLLHSDSVMCDLRKTVHTQALHGRNVIRAHSRMLVRDSSSCEAATTYNSSKTLCTSIYYVLH